MARARQHPFAPLSWIRGGVAGHCIVTTPQEYAVSYHMCTAASCVRTAESTGSFLPRQLRQVA
ncbi:hypothetical protein BDY21DRAFT_334995 [Lineolata rhizophorae]|uniref:Uncharacterized protein n=1 Tax=Lineolata rhizophorae TaxID=578093 RepID=A0A6A6P8J9_9PEZI|nr:hypothetical protein BDY21DRAFT_334995 [Lineolata rhizophorae]